jgi:type 1 glutamine amidotransferase
MRPTISGFLVPVLAVALTVSYASAAHKAGGVSDETVRKIEEALPEEATVTPARPRKMLIFSKCWGFRHGAIGVGKQALAMLGKQTGAYEPVISDDPEMLTPAKLAQFDAVCINNATTGKAPDEIVQALADYVKRGNGIVGIHGATDGKLGAVFSGYFSGHPWHEDVRIKIDDPDHPLNRAFEGKNFVIKDEIYQFNKGAYSREKVRVLLSLDMETTRHKGNRADQDYAVSWVRTLGEGRVFYCSLGHRDEIFWNAKILRHYLDGIQWALGDLKADATPSAKVSTGEGTASRHAAGGGEWKHLVREKDLDGWMSDGGGTPGDAWVVQDGILVLEKRDPGGRERRGGYIWTQERFDDFVLELQLKTWGNSGIFIRTDNPGAPVQTGIEIQVHRSGGPGNTHGFGAVYDCLAPSKPVGDEKGDEPSWHPVRIACKDNIIRVAIDGEQVIDMDLNKWDTPRKNPDGSENKFGRALKDFKRDGHIGFQDHGAKVMYRNVRVREL